MRKLAVGIMSGTSLDGIDVLVGYVEGSFKKTKVDVVSFKTYPLTEPLKLKIRNAIGNKLSIDELTSLNFAIAYRISVCIKDMLKSIGNITCDDVDFIASHGQTVYHIPNDADNNIKSTLQLGSGPVIANELGILTVSNFREADMAVGGQGAPLVPYADYILFSDEHKNRIMLNIGGISNITYLKKNGSLDDVIAFDIGPGNMMIDYMMMKLYGKSFDKNGDTAKLGQIHPKLLDELLDNPYFKALPPKTTGRELFGDHYCDYLLHKYKDVKKEDIIHTLTYMVSKLIKDGCEMVCKEPFEIIASGGGARNTYMMALLKEQIKGIGTLSLSSDYGIDVDAKEALAFIILANETLMGNPSNVPSATGAKRAVILGQISKMIK